MPPDGVPALVGATGAPPLATLAAKPQPSVIVSAAANHRESGDRHAGDHCSDQEARGGYSQTTYAMIKTKEVDAALRYQRSQIPQVVYTLVEQPGLRWVLTWLC